jgi:short-subunit dehydrogenase
LALYAATKAFIVHFSQALWAENRSQGVHVLVVCPGPTATEFFAVADMERNSVLMASQTYEDPQIVVIAALKALEKRQAMVVTGGLKNQAIGLASRLAPRQLLLNLLEPEFRPSDEPPDLDQPV